MAGAERRDDDRMNCRYQDKSYNELFKNWRRQTRDSLGFYYVNNPNELTYRDGYGFVKEYPEAAEANSMRHVYKVLGISLLVLTLLDMLHTFIVPYLLGKLGFDIYYDFFARRLYGSEWLIMALKLIFEVLKRSFPILYCYKYLRMPLKVMLPMKVTNEALYKYAVPIMLLAAGVDSAATGVYRFILGSVNISADPAYRLPDDPVQLAVSAVLYVVLIPALSEICTRGVILQLLRQFGDGFAIICTAFISAAITYNITNFCYAFLVTAIIGYFTVRTGSVKTAVKMRITAAGFAYLVFIEEKLLPQGIGGVVIMATLFAAIMTGLIAVIRFMLRHSDKLGMSMRSRYLTFSDKCYAAITSVPMVLWFSLTLIMIILGISIG